MGLVLLATLGLAATMPTRGATPRLLLPARAAPPARPSAAGCQPPLPLRRLAAAAAARRPAAMANTAASATPLPRGNLARRAVRLALLALVLGLRALRLVGSWAWIWLPLSAYWGLPALEAMIAADTHTALAAAMRGGEALEQLVDMACSSVFLPVVGILNAILIGLTIDGLWTKQADFAKGLTLDCARTALLVGGLRAGLAGATAAERARALGLLRAQMDELLGMLDRAPPAAAAAAAAAADGAPSAAASAAALKGLVALVELVDGAPPDAPASAVAAHALLAAELRALALSACERVSTLRTSLPLVHWATLGGLATSLAFSFWIVATGPSAGVATTAGAVVLNCVSPRIRLLFCGLLGSMAFSFKMIADLEAPLRGSYRVRASDVASLPLLRRARSRVDELLAEAEAEAPAASGAL